MFGRVDRYIEPFFGSGAVLFANPHPPNIELVCDIDGFIANFWRALAADPDTVAFYADWPAFHHDLRARHKWLWEQRDELSDRLSGDPDYYDTKVAGYWLWGICQWPAPGWCNREPNGQLVDGRPHVGPGRGVSVHRSQLDAIDIADRGKRLRPWFRKLANRLARVLTMCRSWERALTHSAITGAGVCVDTAIFLDPPYRTADNRRGHRMTYISDSHGMSEDIAVAAFKWAVDKGNDYKVAYCAREGDFEVPEGWTSLTHSMNGFVRKKEGDSIVMFSPRCIKPPNLLDLL